MKKLLLTIPWLLIGCGASDSGASAPSLGPSSGTGGQSSVLAETGGSGSATGAGGQGALGTGGSSSTGCDATVTIPTGCASISCKGGVWICGLAAGTGGARGTGGAASTGGALGTGGASGVTCADRNYQGTVQHMCGGTCVTIDDPFNCGRCAHQCASDQRCSGWPLGVAANACCIAVDPTGNPTNGDTCVSSTGVATGTGGAAGTGGSTGAPVNCFVGATCTGTGTCTNPVSLGVCTCTNGQQRGC